MSSLPLLCFGHVYHARQQPKKHGFRYRTFFIRLPLRAMESSAMKSRFFSHNRWNLLSFHDADYGDGKRPVTVWIDDLLRQEGIGDADGEVWLQTFPRIFGYVFNPVSFFFCYRADGRLRAVLCEVNNTFGERHYYLLEHGSTIASGQQLAARKVFHVSPFFPVDGEYRFRFTQNKRHSGEQVLEHFTAQVNLHSGNKLLLRTSLSGTAFILSDRCIVKAVLAYPLMTLAVVAHIHWQALRLWCKRVPFFRKPAPPTNSLSR